MATKKVRKANKDYNLVPAKHDHEKRILAFDPGSRNFGISCVGVRNNRIEVIANSIMTHPITSLVDNYQTHLNIFISELAQWINLYEPDGFIMERFQTRGHVGGPLIELVSVMIGAITTEYRFTPCRIVAASTWKNSFHRRFAVQLDDLYKQCLTTPHQLDATLIGCFGLEAGMNRELEYDPDSIIRQTETSARLDLRRPRK